MDCKCCVWEEKRVGQIDKIESISKRLYLCVVRHKVVFLEGATVIQLSWETYIESALSLKLASLTNFPMRPYSQHLDFRVTLHPFLHMDTDKQYTNIHFGSVKMVMRHWGRLRQHAMLHISTIVSSSSIGQMYPLNRRIILHTYTYIHINLQPKGATCITTQTPCQANIFEICIWPWSGCSSGSSVSGFPGVGGPYAHQSGTATPSSPGHIVLSVHHLLKATKKKPDQNLHHTHQHCYTNLPTPAKVHRLITNI